VTVPPSARPPTPQVRPEAAPPPEGVDPAADRMLAATRAGSNRAWATLLQHLDPRARRLAHLVLGGRATDEVLLVAYVRAYRARRKGSPDAVVFLLNHVWMACGHEIRRRQRRGSPAPGRRAAPADAAPRLGDDALGRAVAALRPEERAVWALAEQEGLPDEVVAAALGVDPRVVGAVADRVSTLVEDSLLVATDPATGDLDAPADEDGPAGDDPTDDDPAVDDLAVDDLAGDAAAGDDPGALEPEPASPAFWSQLGTRLRAEREALPAAPPPRLPVPGEPSPALTPAKAPPVAMQKRAPRRSRRSQPDLVEGLAEEADRQRERRAWPAVALRVAVVVVPLALLGGLVLALYLAASSAKSPVRGNTTAAVAGRSLDRLASSEGWTATVRRTVVAPDGTRSEATMAVTAAEDGSYRVEEEGGRTVTHDARLGVLQDVIPGFGIRHEVGVAPGPPDPTVPRADLPMAEIALATRALATETDTEPTRAEVDGVRVWRLAGALEGGQRVTYTVDAAELLPVRITWTREGEIVRDVRFSDVALGVTGASFTQELPPDSPAATPQGFVPVQLGEIRGRIDMVPLTPDFLPTGFTISGASIHEESRIVSLRYTRGPAEIVVTLRPSPVKAGETWDDPFDRGDEAVEAEPVTLEQGPFRDVEAQVVAGGTALPSVWGADGEQAFTVSGDLSPDDLLAVARSLG